MNVLLTFLDLYVFIEITLQQSMQFITTTST